MCMCIFSLSFAELSWRWLGVKGVPDRLPIRAVPGHRSAIDRPDPVCPHVTTRSDALYLKCVAASIKLGTHNIPL
ncbi:hypothetical protein B0J13DRAFT_578841 [Dactylonectria estremocensis]|uniref:Secreted protein n=1 Tax=Dactylonectria estremocensis TaxID=1079267 RepID=A0A9P9CYY8_9HYPO|nr:hypothetical protein B0J13DRAFT_578841 [Dactylonectria estremocensis]